MKLQIEQLKSLTPNKLRDHYGSMKTQFEEYVAFLQGEHDAARKQLNQPAQEHDVRLSLERLVASLETQIPQVIKRADDAEQRLFEFSQMLRDV